MSQEDRAWLEDALKKYTFNDTSRLKEIVDEMIALREAGGDQTEEMVERLAG